MTITKAGSKSSVPGPEDWFTGTATIDPLFEANESRRAAASKVSFVPGARTAWHTHPLGQTLIVTSGKGWVQKWGEAIQEIFPGDVVWFEPNEKHWHGATSGSSMSHIAIQENLNGKVVDWMEKVTEAQYLAAI